MAGKIDHAITMIIQRKAKGNPTLMSVTKTKLILKGINPDKFGPNSPDDPAVLQKLKALAQELGVAL